MSRTNVSLIEQVLNGIRIPLGIDNIHIHCEQIAGHPISRQTIKRELSRLTSEEAYKFSWIKRVGHGKYQYVPSTKPDVEDFTSSKQQAKISVYATDSETVVCSIKIPAQFTKIQLMIEKI